MHACLPAPRLQTAPPPSPAPVRRHHRRRHCGVASNRQQNDGDDDENAVKKKNNDDTWLILPVVICLSQSLSHASVSSRHALERAKPRMAQEPDLILGTVILLGGDG